MAEETNNPSFEIRRLYLKDASLESPSAPEIFLKEFKPEVGVELNTRTKALAEDTHDVELLVTVTAKVDGEVAYLAEVKQAGIFFVSGYTPEQNAELLGSHCPSVLFPFVRSQIASLIQDAGFPQLMLAPINFQALYFQRQQEQKAAEETTKH